MVQLYHSILQRAGSGIQDYMNYIRKQTRKKILSEKGRKKQKETLKQFNNTVLSKTDKTVSKTDNDFQSNTTFISGEFSGSKEYMINRVRNAYTLFNAARLHFLAIAFFGCF